MARLPILTPASPAWASTFVHAPSAFVGPINFLMFGHQKVRSTANSRRLAEST